MIAARDCGNHCVARSNAAPTVHRNCRKPLACMLCRKQRAVRSQGHQHYSCATAFNKFVCGGQLFRLGAERASDTFPQFSHARFEEKHPEVDVLQAAARGIQNQADVHLSAEFGNPLIIISRWARRQAAARHDEFGRLRCHPQSVETARLL